MTGMFKHSRGITYPEILLALVIFVVTATGIVGAYFAMNNLSDYSTKSMRATSDAQLLMEHLNATSFDSIAATFPAGVADGGGTVYSTVVGGYTLPSESITVTYPSETTDRLEIVVTLNWQFRTRSHSVVLSTVRVRS